MLSLQEFALIVIILITFLLILWNHIPTELVAIGVLLVLGFGQLVTTEQAISGFSSSVVITLIGLFVITHALEETGIIQWIAEHLNQLGRGSELRLIMIFMLTGATLSLVMNNVAAGAVLLPAAVRVARISKVSVSRLLIPMSFGTLVGGMATYLTTANIVMSSLLDTYGLVGLGMLDFIPIGGLIILGTLTYMVLVGRHLLPVRTSIKQSTMDQDLQITYQLEERLWEMRVLPDSPLIHGTIGQSRLGGRFGVTVMALKHGKTIHQPVSIKDRIEAGDHLMVLGRSERITLLLEQGLVLADDNQHVLKPAFTVDLTEVIIPPRSNAIGQSLSQLKFREAFGANAVALWREGRSYRTDVGKLTLQVGDALLVTGSHDDIKRLAEDRHYIVPTSDYSTLPLRRDKARHCLLITTVVLFFAISDLVPLPLIMLGGAVAMVLTECLDMQEFYASIEWKVIFLIAGILPLSIAIVETGLADRVGSLFVILLAGGSPLVLIAGVFILTMLITQVIGGQVTALLVGPIAINTALQLNVSPQALAVTVAIACSTAFLTPIAHPVNILMMGAGGYQFGDFFRVGIGMTIVTLVMLLLGMALIWGIR